MILFQEYIMWGFLIASAIFFFYSLRDPEAQLKIRINKQGDFEGLSKKECLKKLGKLRETKNFEDGSSTITWAAGKVTITIFFDKTGTYSRIIEKELNYSQNTKIQLQ